MTSASTRPGPERTCVGCGAKAHADDLVRVVLGPNGEVAIDAAGGSFGRGAHVHATAECISGACKGGLSRSFKTQVKARSQELAQAIVDAYDRRVEGLLSAAVRGGAVAVGADAAIEAMRGGEAELVVVAKDAGRIADDREVVAMIADGKAIAWGDKRLLGALTRRDEVAIVVVKSDRIAAEVRRAWARGDGCRSREVR